MDGGGEADANDAQQQGCGGPTGCAAGEGADDVGDERLVAVDEPEEPGGQLVEDGFGPLRWRVGEGAERREQVDGEVLVVLGHRLGEADGGGREQSTNGEHGDDAALGLEGATGLGGRHTVGQSVIEASDRGGERRDAFTGLDALDDAHDPLALCGEFGDAGVESAEGGVQVLERGVLAWAALCRKDFGYRGQRETGVDEPADPEQSGEVIEPVVADAARQSRDREEANGVVVPHGADRGARDVGEFFDAHAFTVACDATSQSRAVRDRRSPCHSEGMQSVYEAAGGADGLLALAHAWHERVMADDVVAHAFSHGFRDDHSERFAAYLGEALGGPPTYTRNYGDESSVVRIHSGNGEHTDMDNRAIRCWDEALGDIGLTPDGPLWRTLHDYFAWATRTPMARFHESPDEVPNGLRLRTWDWDGLVP